MTCIAGGMAEAFYGIPAEMVDECRKRLPKDMLGWLNGLIIPGEEKQPEDLRKVWYV